MHCLSNTIYQRFATQLAGGADRRRFCIPQQPSPCKTLCACEASPPHHLASRTRSPNSTTILKDSEGTGDARAIPSPRLHRSSVPHSLLNISAPTHQKRCELITRTRNVGRTSQVLRYLPAQRDQCKDDVDHEQLASGKKRTGIGRAPTK